jgi:hypothetical protein
MGQIPIASTTGAGDTSTTRRRMLPSRFLLQAAGIEEAACSINKPAFAA